MTRRVCSAHASPDEPNERAKQCDRIISMGCTAANNVADSERLHKRPAIITPGTISDSFHGRENWYRTSVGDGHRICAGIAVGFGKTDVELAAGKLEFRLDFGDRPRELLLYVDVRRRDFLQV